MSYKHLNKNVLTKSQRHNFGFFCQSDIFHSPSLRPLQQGWRGLRGGEWRWRGGVSQQCGKAILPILTGSPETPRSE